MKTSLSLIRCLRNFFVAAFSLSLAVAQAQTVPNPTTSSSIPNAPALNGKEPLGILPAQTKIGGGMFPSYPWFGDNPIPTEDELRLLFAARDKVELDLDVNITTRTYAERYGTADDLVRTLMLSNPAFNNPDYQDYLPRYLSHQLLHDTTWEIGLENSRDFLLPDPFLTPKFSSLGEPLSIHLSSSKGGGHRLTKEEKLAHLERVASNPNYPPEQFKQIRATFALDDIHQAALQDKAAQAALQKVRDAYQALDNAVRAAMKKDPAVKALLEKYPYLLYGRHDLGFHVAAMMDVT